MTGLDVIHVDFAKYVNERVQRLRAFFSYLYDKAEYHKPSLIVIDNMDKLLSAEVEVRPSRQKPSIPASSLT